MGISLFNSNWRRFLCYRALYKWGALCRYFPLLARQLRPWCFSFFNFLLLAAISFLASSGTIDVDWNLCKFGKRTRGKVFCSHYSFKGPYFDKFKLERGFTRGTIFLEETIIFTLTISRLSRRNKILTPQGTPSRDCSSTHVTGNSILWNERRDWIIISVIISAVIAPYSLQTW